MRTSNQKNSHFIFRAISKIAVVAVFLLLFSANAMAAYTTIAFKASQYANGWCASNVNTTPAVTSPFPYYFIALTASQCASDASGWGYLGYSTGGAAQANTGYKVATLSATYRFDINGFDVNNQTGGAYSITVTSYSDTAATTTIQTETFSVPAGASTVTLNGSHLSAVVTTISHTSTTLLSFKNFQLQSNTLSAPTATTNAASSITSTGATLNGTVSSNGASTTVTFDYGLTTGYGSTATATQSPLATSATNTAVSAAITGLTSGTTYHFRVKGVNSAGTTNGSDATFTTSSTVTTQATNGTITSTNNPTVNYGSTTTVTGSATAGYYFTGVSGCGGTTQSNTDRTITTFSYTTGAITGACTVTATFAIKTFTVTPSAGANGTISPSSAQAISNGTTTTFTVTPNSGYIASMGGTCGGTLSGTTYSTNAITSNCTVTATFTAILPNCTYSLSNSTQTFSANVGTGSFNVKQNETSCNNSGWTAASNASWITLTPSSGNWSSTPVTITVSANTSNAQRTGAITITGQSNSATITITQNALLSFSPSTLNYGTLKPGESATLSLTVTNVSGGSLTLSGVNITGANSAEFILTNNCSTLSNNGTCTLDVKFTAATAGSKTATLTLSANGISFAATLTGTADDNAKPMISVTPSEVNGYLDLEFGSYITLTAGNTGTGTLLIKSMKFYGEDLYEYAIANSCSLIRPSESCSISLSSAYASNQAKNASLVITSNASNAGKLEIPVNMNSNCAAGSVNITPGSATISAAASAGIITVTTIDKCAWIAPSKSDWISANANWTQGNGTVNYTVSANTGSASRIGTINIGGIPFTIVQYAPNMSRIYADISGYKFEDNINALYSAGIASQAANFYPANQATKEDIAVYIIRTIYGETFTYTTAPYFSDVPASHPSFKYVQKLKDDNITWATGVYDIGAGIKRSQAAGFVIRAIYGETFNYPSAPYFSDVPVNHVYFKYIQKMKERGFTHVPTGSEYLPDNIMDRDSLAAFITDAFLGIEHY